MMERPVRSDAFSPSQTGKSAYPEIPVAARIIEYIENNYAAPISLRNIAETFGYSPSHLTNTFSRTTGTPITAWIIKRRIRAAQQLLRETGVNVFTVCETVGFNDLGYFRRQFVRHVGVTPGRFRLTTEQSGVSHAFRPNVGVSPFK
jgi:AraC-like DNA-binding protein